ncbi:hemicentin-2-like isoform X2 [Gigantopelta aegis]|nr:hemicentin-2-like isoform X2 [Gigantopelta aegis]
MEWRINRDPLIVLKRNMTYAYKRRSRFVAGIEYKFVPHADMNTIPPTLYECIAVISGKTTATNYELQVAIVPSDPKITSSNVVRAGQPLIFTCRSDRGQPQPELSWQIGSVLYPGHQSAVPDVHRTMSATNSLAITLGPNDHNKTLTCHWEYKFEDRKRSDSQLLYVQYVPIVTVPVPTHRFLLHEQASIACHVRAVPPAHVVWKKQGILIQLNDRRYSNTPDTTLTFNNVTTADNGAYVCHATNTLGTTRSKQISIIVIYRPILSIAPKMTLINEGLTVQLMCIIDAYPPSTRLVWKKYVNFEWNIVECFGRFSCGSLKSPSMMTIKPVHRDDAAEYACEVHNEINRTLSSLVPVIVTYRPTLTLTPKQVYINEGSSVQLMCTIDAYPPATKVVWEKYIDSKWDVIKCSGRFSCGSLESPSMMTIKPVHRDDTAEYSCGVYNEINGTQSSEAEIIVSYRPTLTLAPKQVTINEGSSVQLMCTIDAYPPANKVVWKKYIPVNSKWDVVECLGRFSCRSLDSPSTMTIKPVHRDDAADYACEVHNKINKTLSSPAQIIVTYRPTLTLTPKEVTINEGSSVQLMCTIDAYPTATKVVWKKYINSKWDVIECSERFFCGSLESPSNLTITPVHRDDATEYVCEVYNEVDRTLSAQVSVFVTYRPTVIITPHHITIREGLNVELMCSIDSYPPPKKVMWRKYINLNQKTLVCSGRFSCGSLESPSNLTIKPVHRADAAEYACEVDNGINTTLSSRVRVTVIYPPTLTITPELVRIQEGLDVQLMCSIDANPPATKIIWKKYVNSDAQTIVCSGRYLCGPLRSPSLDVMTIMPVHPDDAADYACEVYNEINSTLSLRARILVSYVMQTCNTDGQTETSGKIFEQSTSQLHNQEIESDRPGSDPTTSAKRDLKCDQNMDELLEYRISEFRAKITNHQRELEIMDTEHDLRMELLQLQLQKEKENAQ